MVKINYLPAGYYVVCLSTAFSLFAYFEFNLLGNWENGDLLSWIVSFTLMQVLILVIQVSGLILCLYGYRKKEDLHSLLLVDIFLVFWGILVAYIAYGAYNISVMEEVYREPTEVSIPVLWYGLGYGVWIFKGLLWTLSGLVFILTDYVQNVRKEEAERT